MNFVLFVVVIRSCINVVAILPCCIGYQNIHQCPCTQRYITGAAKCSTKLHYKLLTSIFAVVKTGPQIQNDTYFSRSGVNQMWILKKLKRLAGDSESRSQHGCSINKLLDFWTLYTIIPHTLLDLELNNSLSGASQRRTDNKCVSNLLLIVTNLTLQKAISNLIINKNKTGSFK
jgi:hypothetical protein